MLCDNGETTLRCNALCYLIWYHILSHCGILLCDILHDLSLYYGALCFSVLQFHYLYCFVRFCCAFGCVVVCFVSLYIYMYICIRTLFMIYVYIVLCYIKFPCFVPCIQSGQYFGVSPSLSIYICMYILSIHIYILYVLCTNYTHTN